LTRRTQSIASPINSNADNAATMQKNIEQLIMQPRSRIEKDRGHLDASIGARHFIKAVLPFKKIACA
jgi:hypothetical protein